MSVTAMAHMCAALAPFSEKQIARAANAHPKTAARWKRGEAVPSGDAVLRMMATDDDLLRAILRAAGRADHATRAAALQHLALALAALEGRP
jgi:hypothetical protein